MPIDRAVGRSVGSNESPVLNSMSGSLTVSPDTTDALQMAEPARAVALFQILIGSARLWHGSAKLGPYKSITNSEKSAQNPPHHGLRTTHSDDDHRYGDKRPHTDHVNHVQRGSFTQTDLARKLWGL